MRRFFLPRLFSLQAPGIIALSVVPSAIAAQSSLKDRTLFGVKLNRFVTELLLEVEQGFGRTVEEEWLSSTDRMSGRAKIGENGTPVIMLNPKAIHQDVIVHELYHLKLKLQGYPALHWVFPGILDNQNSRAAMQDLSERVYDPIVHSIFYRHASKQGIDPGKTYKNNLIRQLQDGTIAQAVRVSNERDIALNFFIVLTEFGNGHVAKQIERLVNSAGKKTGVELARKLDQIVKQAKSNSPQSSVATLITCLNILYDGEFTFRQQHPWRLLSKGGFTEAIATIRLSQ